MGLMLDASVPVTKAQLDASKTAGITAWAGYLKSPSAYYPWAPVTLALAARELGGVLPIYVSPVTPPGAARGTADAVSAITQLDAAGLTRSVALDIEYGSGWGTNVIAYAGAFCARIHAAGGFAAVYGPTELLARLAKLPGASRPYAPWLAAWTHTGHVLPTPSLTTNWPAALNSWPANVRGWQYTNDVQLYGVQTDVSIIGPTFPLAKLKTPTPPPPPPVVVKTLQVKFGNGATASGPSPLTVIELI